jgi:hypothetical protein
VHATLAFYEGAPASSPRQELLRALMLAAASSAPEYDLAVFTLQRRIA